MRWIAAMHERLLGLFFGAREDAATREELRFHIEMETERIMRDRGLDRREARRLAHVAFGGVERYRDEVREARGWAWLSGLSLDFKLGLRNLIKHPGLAIVGGLGMAVATAVGAGGYAVINSYFMPDLPLHEGDRVVRILKVDTRYGGDNRRLLHDLVVWRRELRSVVDIGAFRSVDRNLIAPSGEGVPLDIVEMTASGFRVARVPPLLGRPLLDADEHPDAPPVVVIGYDVWQSRFEGDRSVVGRTMRLGRAVHTIVGVMPKGYAFPVNDSYWVPLRVPPGERVKPGQGPSLYVFGRLVPGATTAAAEAELAVIAERQRLAADPADLEGTRFRFRPLVAPYTDVFTHAAAENEGPVYRIVQLILSLLMVVVCLNVAVLVYARTVARSTEIAVRTALGATRRRIVGQLFAEASVLSGLSALFGLTLVAIGLKLLNQTFASNGPPPFWIQTGLSTGTVLYALTLALLGAVIVGVLPALRATGTQIRMTMGSVGGGTAPKLGRTWTFLIVAQVAIAVAVLPPAMLNGGEMLRHANQTLGFPAAEFLSAQFVIDDIDLEGGGDAAADSVRRDSLRATVPALVARLETQPGVVGVTTGTAIPGGGGSARVELDVSGKSARVDATNVDQEFFRVFGVRILAGRSFSPADAALLDNRPVIVNRSFVDQALGGAEAVGRRLRYPSDADTVKQWIEIVGVVEDFPAGYKTPLETGARVYHLMQPSERSSGMLFVRLRGQTPDGFAPTLRRIAPTVDPTLQLPSVESLATTYAEERRVSALVALAIAVITGSVLLLSAAGIHALMSFTVNQRRREIGVRAALGAGARQILTSVLARASRQLVVGVGVGLVLAFAVDRASGGDLLNGKGAMVVPAVALCMLVVGLLAASGPARRGLRVQPTEALRAEG
jgi:putative ABC transport system permease protein